VAEWRCTHQIRRTPQIPDVQISPSPETRDYPNISETADRSRHAFHCEMGKAVKVKSSSPYSAKLELTAVQLSFHLRVNAIRAASTAWWLAAWTKASPNLSRKIQLDFQAPRNPH